MNDLPQNELFSAYLDGELTAAEQAEMERLLATDPAARQLLDELRALSNTLQSLPQEKLGADLTHDVLRVAEQRMLTGGEPNKTDETPAEPLERSIFQRFLSRRTIVWLSLTAAVALMIVISDQREGAGPMQVARQVAEAPLAANNRVVARKPGPPPSMQAAHDMDKNSISRPEQVAEKTADRESNEAVGGMGVAASPTLPESSGPINAPSIAAPRSMAKNALTKAKDEHVAENILVVRCEISPEAAEQQAFEKLLDANGLSRRERLARRDVSDVSKEQAEEETKQQARAKAMPPSIAKSKAAATGQATPVDKLGVQDSRSAETLIVVEATQAQIDTILAGLKAQPNVFLALSVNPAHGGLSPETVRAFASGGKQQGGQASDANGFEFSQRTQVAGPGAGKGAVGQLDVVAREPQRQPKADQQQNAVTLNEAKQQDDSTVRRRVLFVLHVANDGIKAESDAAKPATPAATVPAKGK